MRKGGGQKSRRDDILITRGKRRRSATPGLNANGTPPATVVRQKKQCSYMAGNTEMMKKRCFVFASYTDFCKNLSLVVATQKFWA